MVGLVISADVDAGVAKSAKDGGHSCGAFETEGLAFVGRRALRLNFFEQFGGYPAAGGLAFVHFFGGFGTEDVDVAENWSGQMAVVEVTLQFAEFFDVVAELGDGVVGAGGDFLFELQILVGAIGFGVFERGDGDSDPEWHSAGLAHFGDQADELNGVEIEDRGRGGGVGGFWIVAGDGEDVFDGEGVQIFEGFAESGAVAAGAGEVDIWSETAGAGGSADADRVVSQCSASVTRDASGSDAWDAGELRGDIEKQSFAFEAAGDEFDYVAKFSAGERFAQRVRRVPFIFLVLCERFSFPRPLRRALRMPRRAVDGSSRSREE